ncbi:DUF5641 domain-containing protein [Trichonephila inaurata madagascariensis]|uniref:DUF5641 domain-containing protein n=1 Tax=Trichonephila inaurata madagascariensis TaxID=2747483 RepID=A0A8X6YED9_9ARAC|nr:DUF5641 domain-containing protein [Trichonephila inaurata madagascariensis]
MFICRNINCETTDLDQADRSSLVKRTKYLQKLREDLRQRFRNEYLALLVRRGKRRNDALEVGDVVLIGHDNVQRINWPLGVVLEVFPGKDGVPRVARIRTSHGERISLFQRLYPLEVSAKTEISVLKVSGKDSLPVEETPESSTDHVSDSPTDYVSDSSVESTDNSEEKPPNKTRLGRTIKIPRKLDLVPLWKDFCSFTLHLRREWRKRGHQGVEKGEGRRRPRDRVEKERAMEHSDTHPEKKGRREWRDKSEFCNILMLKGK